MGPENQRLESQALQQISSDLPHWRLEGEHLHRSFRFADFPQAMAFMNECAGEAERLDHHPNWSNVYNRVEVELWSHELGGVSALCVELARFMEEVAQRLREAN